MSLCTFLSLFQLNWFEANQLTKNRTDASALLFNAYYACRLQFCIGFNYLLTLQWRSDDSTCADPRGSSNSGNHPESLTGFQSIVLGMQCGEVMKVFFTIMPVLVALFAFITFFNIHAKIFKFFDIDVYSRPNYSDQEHVKRISDGKNLVEREVGRMRTESGTMIEGTGGIRSLGYQAPRRSLVLANGIDIAASGFGNGGGGGKRGGNNSSGSGSSGSGNSSKVGKQQKMIKKKKKNKTKKNKEKLLNGNEEQGQSLLGDDSLSDSNDIEKNDDGLDFGSSYMGAGTRAIMSGGGGGGSGGGEPKKASPSRWSALILGGPLAG